MPEISTATLNNVVTALSELDANKAADTIGLTETAKKEVGMVRQVVSDMLDDLFGASKKTQTAT